MSGLRRSAILIAAILSGAAGIMAASPATTHSTKKNSPTWQLSADEINRIRQSLLRPSDKRAEFQFRHNVEQRFAAATSRPVNEFSDESPMQEAMEIIHNGDASMRGDVRILTDPPLIAEFKATVLPMIVRGCGSPNGCHGTTGHGGFYLSYHLGNAGEVYADFAELRRYVNVIQPDKNSVFTAPIKHWMINPDGPENSLLVQYALPPVMAHVPHPRVKYWAPMAMDKTEPRYRQLVKWIGELRDDADQ
jgi:hypothetical protein